MRIEDILQAVSRAQRHLVGMSVDSFLADEKTIQAVDRSRSVRAAPPEGAEHSPLFKSLLRAYLAETE